MGVGVHALPKPMVFSINTTSSQRSNFQPQFDNVPVGSKPQARCTPMDPWLAESPITAINLCTSVRSACVINSLSNSRPSPRPLADAAG